MSSFAAPFGTALIALSGTILSADATYCAIMDAPAEGLVGRFIGDFLAHESGSVPTYIVNLVIRTGQPVLSRRDYVTASGRRIRCQVHLCLLNDPEGRPGCIFAIAQPIVWAE